jgi:hypothetical protein
VGHQYFLIVIACDKRKAFAQGSAAKQSILSLRGSMDCFASLAMTAMDYDLNDT